MLGWRQEVLIRLNKLRSAAWVAARYVHRVEKVEKVGSENGRFW